MDNNYSLTAAAAALGTVALADILYKKAKKSYIKLKDKRSKEHINNLLKARDYFKSKRK